MSLYILILSHSFFNSGSTIGVFDWECKILEANSNSGLAKGQLFSNKISLKVGTCEV